MLEEIAIAKIADVVLDKYKKIKEDSKQNVIVTTHETDKFSLTELDDAVTTQKEFDKDNPNLEFENPYKKPCKVKTISIVPDDEFKTKGMIEVYIGDEIFFRNKNFGNFRKIDASVIPLDGGEIIKVNEAIRVFIKSSDESSVGVAVQVTFKA